MSARSLKPNRPVTQPRHQRPCGRFLGACLCKSDLLLTATPALLSATSRAESRMRRGPCFSPEAGAETPALLLSTSISLPPGSVETAALRQEQAPAPVSVSWLRVVQQTHRVLAHDGIPAIELTIWRSRWPGCSPRRSSSCGGRGTIPFDGEHSCGSASSRDPLPRMESPARACAARSQRRPLLRSEICCPRSNVGAAAGNRACRRNIVWAG